MMTNPDQDVTLDEVAREICKWMPDDKMKWNENLRRIVLSAEIADRLNVPTKQIRPERMSRNLDVIREVEEALGYLHSDYISNRMDLIGDYESVIPALDLHDPETRLRAIYRTLRESGEI